MGAVINLVMNGIFIPKYQANGAVIGTVCAEFVVMIYQMLAVRKELPLKQYFREGSPFLLIGAIMFLVVKVINCLEISQIFLKMSSYYHVLIKGYLPLIREPHRCNLFPLSMTLFRKENFHLVIW